MALIGSRGRETPSKGSGFAGRSDIANLHAKLQNITSVDATVKVSQSSRSIDLRAPGSIATIARIDNIAGATPGYLAGGYSATEVIWNGVAWVDKPSGRSWGNDYDADTNAYITRTLLPLFELNGGGVSASYIIGAIDTGTKTFTVDGDLSATLEAGDTIQVLGSDNIPSNDGFYTVVSATYDDVATDTDIVVSEAIPNGVATGASSIYIFDGIRVRAFPIKYATGTRWFFDGTGASDFALGSDIEPALFLLPNYDETAIQLLGHDTTPELRWYTQGTFTCP